MLCFTPVRKWFASLAITGLTLLRIANWGKPSYHHPSKMRTSATALAPRSSNRWPGRGWHRSPVQSATREAGSNELKRLKPLVTSLAPSLAPSRYGDG